MPALIASLIGLAVVLVAGSGLALVIGANRIRERLTAAAFWMIVLGLAVPSVTSLFSAIYQASPIYQTPIDGLDGVGSAAFWSAFLLGHMGLAAALAYSRLGPPAFVENIERGRGRGRERVMPALEAEGDGE